MSEKKAKKTKKKVRKLKIKRVILLVFLIALIVLLFKLALRINVSGVIVTGNEYVLENKIIRLAEITEKTSFLKLNEKEVCQKILKEPLISSCNITKKIDLNVIISVSENKPLFFYNETHKLILSNGLEYDAVNSFGVPTLINCVPNKILLAFVGGLNNINSDIIRNISEIEYAPSVGSDGSYIDEERFMLSMKDGNIVYINIKNIDILNSYNKIYASNGDKKGYYNLDSNYGIYYFKEFESK